MKRALVALLLVAAFLVPAFGQDYGSIDLGQGWINPDNINNQILPESLLAWTSNGFFVDEIDTMARAPLLFGGYQGYSVFTAYGNYESWNGSGVTPVNPFQSPVAPATIANYAVGAYQLGLAMPVPGFDGWRAGFLFGQKSSVAGNLTDGTHADQTRLEGTTTVRTDTQPDNVIDYTTVTTYDATDSESSDRTRIIAALNLGFMGASVYASIDNTGRLLGGAFDEKRTDGVTGTAPRIPSQSTYWGQNAIGKDLAGTDASGKAAAFPGDQVISFGAVGQMAILGMPLTAALNFRSEGKNGADFETRVARRISQTTTYAVDNLPEKITTYKVLEGVDLSGNWNPSAMVLPPGSTIANYSSGLKPAIDLSGSGKLAFYSGLSAALDPTFQIAEGVSLKPRATLSYSLGLESKSTEEVAYGYFSEAQAGATVNREWTYSYKKTVDKGGTVHDLKSQLGSALSLESEDTNLELITGVFVQPYFYSKVTSPKGDVTTIERKYVDAAGTPLPVPAATTSAADAAESIGSLYTGSSVYTVTDAEKTTDSVSDLGLTMSVPVAVRLSFFDKKLSLVGGLNASYEIKETTTASKTSVKTRTETVSLTSDGSTPVAFTPPAAAPAYDYPTETVSKVANAPAWTGTVNFMLRWVPSDNITVDVTGASVKTAIAALDTLLSLNTGIGVSALTHFIDALSMSVTFHF